VFQIDAHRQGPFPSRIADVGVVVDLAVHDLDVMRYISGAELVRVYAETERRIHSLHEDLLTGMVRLSDGTIGTLTINWLTPTKIRELYVTGEQGMFRVDYLTQDLYFYENATAHGYDWDTLRVAARRERRPDDPLRGAQEGTPARRAGSLSGRGARRGARGGDRTGWLEGPGVGAGSRDFGQRASAGDAGG
jgi:predicted dehydrogenase